MLSQNYDYLYQFSDLYIFNQLSFAICHNIEKLTLIDFKFDFNRENMYDLVIIVNDFFFYFGNIEQKNMPFSYLVIVHSSPISSSYLIL